MAYNTERLLTDADGKPIPQRYNPTTGKFDPADNKVEVTNTITDFKTASITVTGTAVELTAALTDRKQIIIYPPDAGTIYWGTSTVTSSNGAPLKSTDLPVEFPAANATKVYAINDGTNRTVRVVESK